MIYDERTIMKLKKIFLKIITVLFLSINIVYATEPPETWYFYKVSKNTALDYESDSERERLIDKYSETKLILIDGDLTLDKICTMPHETTTDIETPLSYWKSPELTDKYKKIFIEEKIPLENQIEVTRNNYENENYPCFKEEFTDLIKTGNFMVFMTKPGYLLIFSENLEKDLSQSNDKSFSKELTQLPIIDTPLNDYDLYELDKEDSLKEIPVHYKKYLDIPSYEGEDILAAKLPSISSNINPYIISYVMDSGERDSYLYLFSDDDKVLDKLLIFSYITTTRGGPGGYGLPVGYRYFNIDKNYSIERRQRFEDETIEIQHYQVNQNGKFKEIPVTSECYNQFPPKDKNKHSSKSLLLSNFQANNYLRSYLEDKNDFYDMTMTLNIEENIFCLNYQQSFPITLNKINAKKFFNNENLYQQQVENFKKVGIDISNELEYITFQNIENTRLTNFLLNGNQAIYMDNKLFFVGENYFAFFWQPKDEELFYE